jgi:hypothetical protein
MIAIENSWDITEWVFWDLVDLYIRNYILGMRRRGHGTE